MDVEVFRSSPIGRGGAGLSDSPDAETAGGGRCDRTPARQPSALSLNPLGG
jgi:hypothetical protein